MDINRNAPVRATGEIEVAVDPEIIWNIMTTIDRWPDWNSEVKSASLKGELTPGSKFWWKAGPGTIKSTIQQVERPKTLAWIGRTLGINAIHVWRLESKDSKTIVKTEESWEGLIPWIFRGPMQKILQKSIDVGLQYLKTEAERRSNSL